MKNKAAYLITSIEEYGKLLSICVNNDISIWRTYWDEREKGSRCYYVDWHEKQCYYSRREYYESNGYNIVTPHFYIDKFGNYQLSATPIKCSTGEIYCGACGAYIASDEYKFCPFCGGEIKCQE